MDAPANSRFKPTTATSGRSFDALFAFVLFVIVALTLSGCIGLTSAGTPAAKSGSGAPSAGTLSASATSLNFGGVVAGSSSLETLTLTNAGESAITISHATVTGAGFSLVEDITSVSIPAGKTHSLQIKFAPTGIGPVSGSVNLTSDAKDSSLEVPLSGKGMASLAITTQPASETVTAGQAARFEIVATGTGTLTYQWKKNGGPINGATASSYTTPITTSADNGEQFTVVVTDKDESLTSNAATLDVTAAPVGPAIASQPANDAVTAGQMATFNVTATGTAPLSYQWRKNGVVISGATAASYTTPATTVSDSGAKFTVTVTNNVSNVTSNPAILNVSSPQPGLLITAQPASVAVTAGQSATFSVVATGAPPLAYQWSRGGSMISGANSSSYTTPATTVADSGEQFTVTVSDDESEVTSAVARLIVNAAPTSVLKASQATLNFSSVDVGSQSLLPVVFSNSGNAQITISNITISGAGYTAGGIQAGQILAPGQSATLNVTFAPASTGTLAGSVTVSSNASDGAVPVTLSGTGVQPQISHSATLAWTASSSTVAGYNAYRSAASGGPYTKLNSVPVAATTYADAAVQSSKVYYYVVTSVDAAGNESVYSTEVSAAIP